MNLEKQKIIEEADKRVQEASSKIRELEKEHEKMVLINERAHRTIEAQRIQLKEFQEKFTEVLAKQDDFVGLDVQGIFNHEYKEKERLNQIIFEQTQTINELQTIKDGLWQENQKFREEFGVPSNFLYLTLDKTKTNHLTRIEYLEREVEQLEEERAELRCKLRQMASLVNPKEWDNDFFTNLNLEQKELICLYAINLLNGKNEVYLTDKSKDLLRQCDSLKMENEILKQNQITQQKTFFEMTRNLPKNITKNANNPKYSENVSQISPQISEKNSEHDEVSEKEKEIGSHQKPHTNNLKNENGGIRELLANRSEKRFSAISVQQNLINRILLELDLCAKSDEFENKMNLELNKNSQRQFGLGKTEKDYMGDVELARNQDFKDYSVSSFLKEKKHEGIGANNHSKKSNISNNDMASIRRSKDPVLAEEILFKIKALKLSLIEKDRILEFNDHQNTNLKRFIEDSCLAQHQQYSLIKENAICQHDNIRLTFENELFALKLEHFSKVLQILKSEKEKHEKNEQMKKMNSEKSIHSAVKKIEELNAKLIDSVPISEFKELQREITEQRQKNIEQALVVESLLKTKSMYYEQTNDYLQLISRLTESQLNEFNLICELKVLEDNLSQSCEDYSIFKNLMRRLIEGLKMKSLLKDKPIFDLLKESLSDLSTETNLRNLFESLEISFYKADYEILSQFLLTSDNGKIIKHDLLRKIKVLNGGWFKSDQTDFYLLKSLIERTNFNIEELFTMFDGDNDDLVSIDDIMSGLRVLDLIDKDSFKEKIQFESAFFGFSKHIKKEIFVSVYRSILERIQKAEMISQQSVTLETKIAFALNEFLKNNEEIGFDENGLFMQIDENQKGFFTCQDFEKFVTEKLDLKMEKYALEKLYSSIPKTGVNEKVSHENFIEFLKRGEIRVGFENRIKQKSILIKPNQGNTKTALKQQQMSNGVKKVFGSDNNIDLFGSCENGSKFRIDLIESEKKALEFSLAHHQLILSQMNERLSILENENNEKGRILNIFKEELAKKKVSVLPTSDNQKLKQLLGKTRNSDKNNVITHLSNNNKSPKNPNIQEKSDEIQREHLENRNETINQHNQAELDNNGLLQNSNDDDFQDRNLLNFYKKEITSLKIQLSIAENEKMEMFKSAACIASQNGVNIKEVVTSTEMRSREVLLLNSLQEKDAEIDFLGEKLDSYQAKWVNEKLANQNILETLCEKLNLVQIELLKYENAKLLLIDVEKLETLNQANQNLSARIIETASEKNKIIQKLNQSETEFEILKNEYQFFVKRVHFNVNQSPDLIVQQLNLVMEESKNNKIAKIKAEKMLMFENSDKNLIQIKLDQMNEIIRKLEIEIEKQIATNQSREVFWSSHYQRMLTLNAKINSGSQNKRDQKSYVNVENPSNQFHDEFDPENIQITDNEQRRNGEFEDYLNLNEEGKIQKSILNQSKPNFQIKPKNIQQTDTNEQLGSDQAVTHKQLKDLMNKLTSNPNNKDALTAAKNSINLIESMLSETRSELLKKSSQLSELRDENLKLKEQLFDINYSVKENAENKSTKNIFGIEGKVKLNSVQKIAFLKPTENQKTMEKTLRIQIETLKTSENSLREELLALKKINNELLIKLKEPPKVFPMDEFEKERLETLNEQFQKKNYVIEDKLKRNEVEIASLLDTIKILKDDLVGLSKSNLTPKKPVIDGNKQKEELESKLKITLKKLKEITQKLKATSEEMIETKEVLAKKEIEISLLKKHEANFGKKESTKECFGDPEKKIENKNQLMKNEKDFADKTQKTIGLFCGKANK